MEGHELTEEKGVSEKLPLPVIYYTKISKLSQWKDSGHIWNGWAQLWIFSAGVLLGVLPPNLPAHLSCVNNNLLPSSDYMLYSRYTFVTVFKVKGMFSQWSALKDIFYWSFLLIKINKTNSYSYSRLCPGNILIKQKK